MRHSDSQNDGQVYGHSGLTTCNCCILIKCSRNYYFIFYKYSSQSLVNFNILLYYIFFMSPLHIIFLLRTLLTNFLIPLYTIFFFCPFGHCNNVSRDFIFVALPLTPQRPITWTLKPYSIYPHNHIGLLLKLYFQLKVSGNQSYPMLGQKYPKSVSTIFKQICFSVSLKYRKKKKNEKEGGNPVKLSLGNWSVWQPTKLAESRERQRARTISIKFCSTAMIAL